MTEILSPVDVRAIHKSQSDEIATFIADRMRAHPTETSQSFSWDHECGVYDSDAMSVLCCAADANPDDNLDVSDSNSFTHEDALTILRPAIETLRSIGWVVNWDGTDSEFEVAYE